MEINIQILKMLCGAGFKSFKMNVHGIFYRINSILLKHGYEQKVSVLHDTLYHN